MTTSEQTRISISRDTTEDYPYKVSIIVPCYNTKPWLDECLQSLVNQTLQDIEIFCVNDGSTNGTGERLDEWQAQYPNKIKVIHQKNGGTAVARNAGMQMAQGECIGFVDSDDIVNLCMYEKLYNILTDNKADIVTCDYLPFNDGENPVNKIKDKSSITNITTVKQGMDEISFTFGLCSSNFLNHNNIKFIADTSSMEDMTFSYDIIMLSPIFFKLEESLYYYRRNRLGQHTSNISKDLYLIFKVFNYLDIRQKNNSNLDLVKQMDDWLLKEKTRAVFAIFKKINIRYKIAFLYKSSIFLFNNSNTKNIYKYAIFKKRNGFLNYLLAIPMLLALHSCYLWQILFLKLTISMKQK